MPATNIKKEIFPFRNTTYLLALIADQVPGDESKAYWLNFFGRPTPFIRGRNVERRWQTLGLFGHLYKTKRGHYRLEYELCTEEASLAPGEITRQICAIPRKSDRERSRNVAMEPSAMEKRWKPEYEKLWIGENPVPRWKTTAFSP